MKSWTLVDCPTEAIPYGEDVSLVTARVVDRTSPFPPSSIQSCPVFSPLHSPQPPGPPDESLQTALTLDDSLLEFCLKNVVMVTDSAPRESTETLELMDNLLTDCFTDISTLVDSSMLGLLPQGEHEDTMDMTFEFSEDALGLSSPSVAMSSVATPLSLSPFPVVPPSPSPVPENVHPHTDTPTLENRKRKMSSVTDDDDETTPPAKISSKDREIEKRKKNNVASQVSRARKRSKVKGLCEREKELEVQNAELRLKVEEMTKEAERLRALLVTQLAK